MKQLRDPALRSLALAVGLLAVALGCLQGLTYGHRLCNPSGNHLVVAGLGPSPERLAKPAGKIVLVVIDGLRADSAMAMRSTDWLQAHGSCRFTDVGALTKSRPVYALLSSGVEPERSGVRSNDVHIAAPVESVWQVARRAGYHVSGASGVSWWRELFPDGFDDYRVEADDVNLFRAAPAHGTVALIHPCYVDDAGHEAGAASSMYREAVARADGELLPFLESLDRNRDVVLVTADHGHTDRGGHGGVAPELRTVLTCAAGHGIAHTQAVHSPTIDARAVPALLAVLAGLPLPRHLDIAPEALAGVLGMVEPAAFPPGHLAAYHREVEQRRDTVARALSTLVRNSPAQWTTLVAQERRMRNARFAFSLGIAVLILLTVTFRRHRTLRATCATALWVALTLSCSYGLTRLTRGSFDLAAVNTGRSFAVAQALTSAVVLLATGGLHLVLSRDLSRLLFDGVILVAAALLLSVAHVVAFGWPVGFPLPTPSLLFLPYPLAAFTAAAGAALLGLAMLALALKHRP